MAQDSEDTTQRVPVFRLNIYTRFMIMLELRSIVYMYVYMVYGRAYSINRSFFIWDVNFQITYAGRSSYHMKLYMYPKHSLYTCGQSHTPLKPSLRTPIKRSHSTQANDTRFITYEMALRTNLIYLHGYMQNSISTRSKVNCRATHFKYSGYTKGWTLACMNTCTIFKDIFVLYSSLQTDIISVTCSIMT